MIKKRFFPGDYYAHSIKGVSKPEDGEHMEHGSSSVDCRRMLAWMVYLNDTDTGYTDFMHQELSIKLLIKYNCH